MFRRQQSRTDTVASVASRGSTRTYLISEASSVLPSLSVSAFSLDLTHDRLDNVHSSGSEVFTPSRFDEGLSSSCKEGLDVFDNPEYTDTVKSIDSTGSMLRRSLSMPPQYAYKGQVSHKHAREVFEDFILAEEAPKDNDNEDSEDDKPWRQTMEDLIERPDYIDSIQSTSSGAALLAKTATSITKAGQETKLVKDEQESEARRKKAERRFYFKNLLVLSIMCFFLFGAYLSLRNLQSSINEDTGLAFYSLSSLYLCFFLGCIFAPTLIQYLRPKRTMVLAHLFILLYVGTNFYPTYYTLLPASIFMGFALANFWTAHSTYLASIGLCYAQVANKSPLVILTKFNGIFFTFFGISQVLGNIIGSTVLMAQMHANNDKMVEFPEEANTSYNDIVNIDNKTTGLNLLVFNLTPTTAMLDLLDGDPALLQCGTKFTPAQANTSGSAIDRHIVYILLSIFSAMVLISMLIAVVFLDPLEGQAKRSNKSVCTQLAAVFRWFTDYKAICLVGLMVYSLLQMAFIFGEFTKAFVTCPMGVHMVGYAMLTMSVSSSISSFFSGIAAKLLGRPVIMTLACLIQLALLFYMLFWEPASDSIVILLVFMALWGFADGILITQIVSIIGALFVENKEPAFAGVKMCQSIGACLTLFSAKYISCYVKIYIIIGLLLVALVTYLMLEFSLWRESTAEVAGKVGEKEKKKAPAPAHV